MSQHLWLAHLPRRLALTATHSTPRNSYRNKSFWLSWMNRCCKITAACVGAVDRGLQLSSCSRHSMVWAQAQHQCHAWSGGSANVFGLQTCVARARAKRSTRRIVPAQGCGGGRGKGVGVMRKRSPADAISGMKCSTARGSSGGYALRQCMGGYTGSGTRSSISVTGSWGRYRAWDQHRERRQECGQGHRGAGGRKGSAAHRQGQQRYKSKIMLTAGRGGASGPWPNTYGMHASCSITEPVPACQL